MKRLFCSAVLAVALAAGTGCHSSESKSGSCACSHTGASACTCAHCKGTGSICNCPKS